MLRVGLTGGIGSGKSEVARRLADRGAVVIDADRAAREVVAAGSPGWHRIVAAFGNDIVGPDGELDRPRLGAVVFADPRRRQTLNEIVHPLVHQRMWALDAVAAAAGNVDTVIVHDVPLLVENGLADRYQVVLVVDAPGQVRVERLVRDRGMSPEQARERMAAQAERQQRLAAADLVVDNAGSLAELDRGVDEAWAWLHRRSVAAGPRDGNGNGDADR